VEGYAVCGFCFSNDSILNKLQLSTSRDAIFISYQIFFIDLLPYPDKDSMYTLGDLKAKLYIKELRPQQ
jgi:hypothetical protein